MAKIHVILLVIAVISNGSAQDFEPSWIEDGNNTTTTVGPAIITTTELLETTTVEIETASTDETSSPVTVGPSTLTTTGTTANPQTEVEDPNTAGPVVTELPTTTTTKTTTTKTTTTEVTTEAANDRTTTTTTTLPPSTTDHPLFGRRCYLREQQGHRYYQWRCGRIHLIVPVTCFLCCEYGNVSCIKVERYFCFNN